MTSSSNTITAYQHLFGTGSPASIDALSHLNLQQVKSRYRQRIKTLHPDKSVHVGIDEHTLTRQFNTITRAYETLSAYIAHKPERSDSSPNPSANTIAKKPVMQQPPPAKPIYPSKVRSDFYYMGWLPAIPLRFGRFLYYRGLISWNMLVDSITWQQTNRPTIGKLCLQEHYLSPDDIAHILYYTRYGDPFGTIAKRLGKLSEEQIQELIEKQHGYRNRLGDYFTVKNIFSPEQIQQFLKELHEHNSRFYTVTHA